MRELRKDRLQAEIQKVVSEILYQEIQDPRIRGAMIQGVHLTGDGGIARIYYDAPQLSEMGRKALQKALEHAKGFVRREVASRLKLRNVPELEFYYEPL